MSVTEPQAQHLQSLLRGHDVDQKIAEFVKVKADIKHYAVSTDAIGLLFDACRAGIQSPNTTLSYHALSCMGHLVRRVSIQDPARLRSQSSHLLPVFIDKLGEPKERNKTVAFNSILGIYKIVPVEVEKAIKEHGLNSKNQRIRLESVKWIAHVHATQSGFSFRSFTPFLMNLLEDSNDSVRDTTKEVVVEMFKNAPEHAKSDLKREMQKRGVRKAIAAFIVSHLGIPGAAQETRSPIIVEDHSDDTTSVKQSGKSIADSVTGSMASSTYVANLPGHDLEDLEPAYVNTARELENMLDEMAPWFEGRESEENWKHRERNCHMIRRLLRGNAYRDYQAVFLAKIKSLLDGILGVANSLRTTASSAGGQLVKDLAIVAGPGLDPLVDIILANLVKLCAGTKKLTSQLGQVVIAVILANVSYHPKLLQHVWMASQDKNVQPRSYAAGWLTVILEAHIDHKPQIEHNGGVEVLAKCIKRGLADANPGVRENMRNTYWRFNTIWPEQGQVILEGLDNNSRKLLEKTNPNVSAQAKGTASLRAPTMGRSQTAPTRPSIKEAILAQKKSRSNLRTQKSAPIVNEMQPPSEPPAPAAPSGLSTAPVRWHGLKSKALHERQFSDPAAATDGGRAPSPTATSNSGKGSPIGNLRSRTPPPVRMARGVTPGRHQSPLGGNNRKLSILDQLNHSDWKVRVEGTVVVACILAKRTPPGYDGQKLQLPPSDVFAPALVRLFNDPQPEVVENVVAPEVLAELMKVVPLDLIVPKILLLSEGDDHHHAQTIKIKTMPALKQQISDTEATDVLFRVLQNLIPSGGVSSKVAIGSFSTTQKKKIARGCLLWMSELVEGFGNGSSTNEFFSNYSNFKLIVNRLLTMFSVTKLQTRTLLAAVLKGLEKIDSEQFNRILRSLEPATTRDLRKEWGITADEDLEPVVIEEQVAGVEQVLGSIPEIGGTTYQDPLHCVPSTTIARDDNLGVEDKITAIDIPPAARPTTPPAQSAQSIDIIGTVPPLPQTPEQSVDLPSDPITARKVGRIEDKPLIKVYQDPVVESNGAVATSTGTLIVGDEWHRSKLKKQISSNSLPKTPGDSSRLLHTIIGRLQNREMDTQAFRKLIGIARVNPVREPLQEANGDDIHDIWQGGPVFEELLTSLLDYLTADDIESARVHDLRVQGLLVLKQLLTKAAPYFARHETDVLQALISLRGLYPLQSQITTGIQEIADEYMQVADPKTGIDALLDLNMPGGDHSSRIATQSLCMSLSCLAALVRASNMSSLESQLERLGQLAVKSLGDGDTEVRQSCVSMCIELHSKVNDDERLFDDILKGMNTGHQNLLAYYFVKREGEPQQ